MEYFYFLGRITICFVLGIAIGFERQCRRRIAGMRTITLVSLGAFLFVSVSSLTTSNDITRIAAQVVSGIGFLGAGVILKDGLNIRGLNTAATLWCSAAIGTLTALDLVVEAIIGVAYILLTNIALRFVSRKMLKQNAKTKMDRYSLVILCEENKEMTIKNLLIQKLKTHQNSIKNFSSKKVEENEIQIEAQLDVFGNSLESMDAIVNKLCIEPGVSSVKFDQISNYADVDDDDYDVK